MILVLFFTVRLLALSGEVGNEPGVASRLLALSGEVGIELGIT
jgi:hypothetical protein